jgi:hypothetical protein
MGDPVREAGMRALRGYHMAHWRDMLTATPHNHPVEKCPTEPFVSLAAALAASQEPESGGLDAVALRRALMDRDLVVLDTRDYGGMRMSDTAASKAIAEAYAAARLRDQP